MLRVPISKIRHELAETLNRVAYRGERVLLQRRNRDVAALISMEDLRLLEYLEDRADIAAAKAALSEAGAVGFVPWEDLKRELDARTRNAEVSD